MRIQTTPVPEVTVSRFENMRSVLEFDPPYQREGDVWSVERRARLIDSIINGFDVPKLYFEKPTTRRVNANGHSVQYAVVDGKQRLESISQFLNGELALPEDFWFFEDRDVEAKGLTFPELQAKYHHLAQRFLDFELPIVSVTADSGDLIEEMFLRLNASTALNAAERRNAISGPTRDAANKLAEHELLTDRAPIKNARYKYRELAAKFLAIEDQLDSKGRIVDTKAATLYELFVASKPAGRVSQAKMTELQDLAQTPLDSMATLFDDNDPLLSSIGTLVVYYIAFREAAFAGAATREKLERFEVLRRDASGMSEDHAEYARAANARLREYNVFVQSSNDGRALHRRAEILSGFVLGYDTTDELAALDTLPDGELPEVDEPGE